MIRVLVAAERNTRSAVWKAGKAIPWRALLGLTRKGCTWWAKVGGPRQKSRNG